MAEHVVRRVKYSNAMRYIQSGSGIESFLPKEILCLFFCGFPRLRDFCQSTEDPTRPPITVMRGSLDPLGMPQTTDAVSGHEPMMASTSRSSRVSGLAERHPVSCWA